MTDPAPRPDRPALGAAIACYVFWGSVVPLTFQAAGHAGATPWEITAWRTVFAAPIAIVLVLATRRLPALWALDRRTIAWLALSALMIGCNWLVYVWAVNVGRTLQTSLGYYLNPLMNVAAGMLVFRERVSRFGWLAIALAAVGVALQAVSVGGLPWVSLVLGGCFVVYGVIRKRVAADAQTGLLVECLILAVPGIAYIAWLALNGGGGHFGRTLPVSLLLIAGGPITVFPLVAFAWAARRLTLTLMGFLQFLAPTLLFVVGVMEGEPLGSLGLLSFGFIWIGVAVFAFDAWSRSRALRLATA
jgi:chloramphenicol-sensitive protein RarD